MPSHALDDSNYGAGDVLIKVFNIISSSGKQLKDLTSRGWNSISYVESMGLMAGDPQFITGEVVIIDRINIFNEMKLVGDEIIELVFETPQKNLISFIGRIYNVDVTMISDKERSLTLKFCSAEKIVADQLKVNRVYKNQPYHLMAQDLFAPFQQVAGKKIYAEPTKNIGSVIINNQSPLDAINTLTSVSRAEKYQGANYVFFERSNGLFVFSSIEGLVDPNEVKPAMKYSLDTLPGNKNDVISLRKIKGYKVLNMPNIVENIRQGVYGSTLISNDLMKRKISIQNFNYDRLYRLHKHVNYNLSPQGQGSTKITNNPRYSERYNSFVKFIPKHFSSFDIDGVPTSNFSDERELTDLERRSQLRQMNAIRLEILVNGDSQRRVGEIVDINLPSIEEQNTEQGGRLDGLLSGKYMISKIKHVIVSKSAGYSTVLQLVKDSFETPLPEKR